MLNRTAKKVILFLPPYSGKILGPPLGLLSLAASVREAGYEPRIIDGALDHDYQDRIRGELDGSLCFGVSLLTGPMIRDAIRASRMVRDLRPDVPIVYGGWHPSLRSEETLREPFVDIVVRHQGEITLVEILRRIDAGQSLGLVSGCWFKRGGRIHMNPDRPAAPLATLAPPAWDLADLDAYERAGGGRKLPYASSVGCPYACNYCTDTVYYNRRFNPYTAERVAEELTDLARRYRLTEIALLDSNFLVDVRRAKAIARGLIDRSARLRWTFQASTDLLCRMTDEEVRLLAESGVTHIGFGTESASPEVLRLMNKPHQHVADIREAARKCAQAGIRVTFNLIFGFPGEQERHQRETLRVMGEIGTEFDNVSFSPNMFTPYPGIPIWPELKAKGLAEPDSLAAWADVDLGLMRLPWVSRSGFTRLSRSIGYFLLDASLNKQRRRTRSAMARSLVKLVRKQVHWRLRTGWLRCPVELWIGTARNRLVIRRSLLTGQPLSLELSRNG
ncbi:MAG TPA: radical SAM protein [Bryobacteraceae bacterium]|nr:radical SAM protein [Bryobacteraceae bacterium]